MRYLLRRPASVLPGRYNGVFDTRVPPDVGDYRCAARCCTFAFNQRDTMKSRAKGPWRISAILVVLSLLAPFAVLFLLSPASQDALLPACCRRHGKHQCMMRMMEAGQDAAGSPSSPHLAQLFEKCPYTPAVAPTATNPLLWHASQSLSSVLRKGDRTTIARGRDSFDSASPSANYKRGPPVFSIPAEPYLWAAAL